MQLEIDLPTEQVSEQIAARLAACIVSPLIITFSGEIGAGKTTLIRAMLRCLGIDSAIKSPTFSLIENYQTEKYTIHHFDLYRIQDETELEYIGFRDYFSDDAICCIEWPERAKRSLAHVDVECILTLCGFGRTLLMRAVSAAGISVVSSLTGGA